MLQTAPEPVSLVGLTSSGYLMELSSFVKPKALKQASENLKQNLMEHCT